MEIPDDQKLENPQCAELEYYNWNVHGRGPRLCYYS